MDVSVVSTSDGLAALQREWEELESDPSTPYYVTHRFVSAWWSSYSQVPGYRLHVVTVRQDGRLVGIGPFAVRPEKHGWGTVPVLRWASHGDYLSVLHASHAGAAKPETISYLLLAELSALVEDGEVARVQLTGIPSNSAFAWHIRRSVRYHRYLAFDTDNPYIDMNRDIVTPTGVGKNRRKLHREHDVSFALYLGDQHGILRRMAAVHLAEKEFLLARGRVERRSLFEEPQRVDHLRAVYDGTDDAVTFALVEGRDPARGRLVGYRTAFRHAGRLLSWNSAYLPEYRAYGTGQVLQLDILERLAELDLGIGVVEEFDLGAGNQQWKFEWTATSRPTYRLLIATPPRPWVRRLGRPVLRVARRTYDSLT